MRVLDAGVKDPREDTNKKVFARTGSSFIAGLHKHWIPLAHPVHCYQVCVLDSSMQVELICNALVVDIDGAPT